MEFDWIEGSNYAQLHEWFRGSMTRQKGSVKLENLQRPRIRVATFNVQMLSGMVKQVLCKREGMCYLLWMMHRLGGGGERVQA